MTAFHVAGERHARPTNPLFSRSRALLAFQARRRYYPGGDEDKVRFLDNHRVPGVMLESRFPVFESSDTPVYVDARNAREAYTRAWIDDEKEIDVRDATVATFATSITCNSVKRGSKKKMPKFPGVRASCGGVYKMCNHDPGTTNIFHSNDKHITRIPACMSKYKNLERIWLDGTRVSRIENLENNVKLRILVLEDTKVSRIDGLDNLVKLETIGLKNTGVSRIENLDTNTKLEYLDLSHTPVSQIENLDKLVNLKYLWLNGTEVSKIENLDTNMKLESIWLKRTQVSCIENLDTNVKLKTLGLGGTKVSRIENIDNLVELEKLWLDGTKVRHIENLDTNVNLKDLGLTGTKVSFEEKHAFKATRPGLDVK